MTRELLRRCCKGWKIPTRARQTCTGAMACPILDRTPVARAVTRDALDAGGARGYTAAWQAVLAAPARWRRVAALVSLDV